MYFYGSLNKNDESVSMLIPPLDSHPPSPYCERLESLRWLLINLVWQLALTTMRASMIHNIVMANCEQAKRLLLKTLRS